MGKNYIFIRMSNNLEEQAIKASLAQNWEKAIEVNKKIIKENPKNIAALNRLAKCYWEIGKIDQALKTYKKVLKFDSFNPIANRNINRLSKGGKIKKTATKKRDPFSSSKIFLEEPGKTKIVTLVRLAQPDILGKLNNADPILMVAKKRLVSILSEDDNYLGTVPEDLSQRLIKFIKAGNKYEGFVKNVDHQHLEIFIHEVNKGKKFANIPSFP